MSVTRKLLTTAMLWVEEVLLILPLQLDKVEKKYPTVVELISRPGAVPEECRVSGLAAVLPRST